MVEVNRRGFLIGAGLTAAAAVAGDEKVMDGGLAETSRPGVPARLVTLASAFSGSRPERVTALVRWTLIRTPSDMKGFLLNRKCLLILVSLYKIPLKKQDN